LRRLALDELPQLWNVLRGEMSLVGPRPIVPPEIDRYGDHAAVLLSVKPGLTGQWQVAHVPVPYPDRAHLDVEYVLGRSLRVDLGILLRTVPALLRRQLKG
jgi:exopolysaccharide production protein ExoY